MVVGEIKTLLLVLFKSTTEDSCCERIVLGRVWRVSVGRRVSWKVPWWRTRDVHMRTEVKEEVTQI